MSETKNRTKSDPPASADPIPAAVTDISTKDVPFVVGCGMCMGTADVVPGVSGGTMAVALGIYRQLLGAITSVDAGAIKSLTKLDVKGLLGRVHWRFIAALGTGIALALAIMVKVVKLPKLVQEQPRLVYAIFFGLVLASAILLARKIPKWNPVRVLSLVAGAGIGFAVVRMTPTATPEHPAFIFFSGMIAISAMLLPGISGSFILLIMGKYAYVLNSLSALKLSVIAPFAFGCLAGLVLFSRFLGWLLAKWHDTVLAGLTGLLIGSLWRIWPYQHLTTVIVRKKPRVIGAEPFMPESWDISVIALFITGLIVVFAIEVVATRRAAAA